MTQLLLTCGVVGPLLFITVFLIEGALRPGYRPWRHFVSLLALGDRGWIQVANFLVCGSLVLAFALGITRVLDSVALPVLFALFGAGLIASGLAPTDPALGYPLGSVAPASPSRAANIHNLAGAFVFLSLIVASFVVAARTAGAWRIYSIATGIAIPISFITSGALAERSIRGELADAPVGAAQRTAIVIGWTWLALFALHLLR